jgi:hypothetical protein
VDKAERMAFAVRLGEPGRMADVEIPVDQGLDQVQREL